MGTIAMSATLTIAAVAAMEATAATLVVAAVGDWRSCRNVGNGAMATILALAVIAVMVVMAAMAAIMAAMSATPSAYRPLQEHICVDEGDEVKGQRPDVEFGKGGAPVALVGRRVVQRRVVRPYKSGGQQRDADAAAARRPLGPERLHVRRRLSVRLYDERERRRAQRTRERRDARQVALPNHQCRVRESHALAALDRVRPGRVGHRKRARRVARLDAASERLAASRRRRRARRAKRIVRCVRRTRASCRRDGSMARGLRWRRRRRRYACRH
eukprot:4051128-Pleurochrysis_carterae.AAC.1